MPHAKEIFPRGHFGHADHRFESPGLDGAVIRNISHTRENNRTRFRNPVLQ